eukprot:8583551-Alexandrium_andersonii.AAC.1
MPPAIGLPLLDHGLREVLRPAKQLVDRRLRHLRREVAECGWRADRPRRALARNTRRGRGAGRGSRGPGP